jgi:beta-glucosidase
MRPGVQPEDADYNPLWEFGFGLSYSKFQYNSFTLSSTSLMAGENLTVTVAIANQGDRAGKEVVQLYTSDHYASITPDKKRLRAFKKVDFAPGEAKIVEFTITEKDLSFINANNKKVIEPGEFSVIVGGINKSFTFN